MLKIRTQALNHLLIQCSHKSSGKKRFGGYQTDCRSDISRWVCFLPCFCSETHLTHWLWGNSVIPESSHQDSVGILARTVRDAVYALDGIYGLDRRDNYTFGQRGKTPFGGYTQFLRNKTALQGATFGLPWKSFWSYAQEPMLTSLLELIELIKAAGAKIINETEIPNYETIVSPNGWNW